MAVRKKRKQDNEMRAKYSLEYFEFVGVAVR